MRVAIGNPIMDRALGAGSQATWDVIDYAARLGVDIMEISVIARAIDDEDLADLLEYVNSKGIKPIVECGLSFAHGPVVDGRTFTNRKKAEGPSALWKTAHGRSLWKLRLTIRT